ncbi:MAG: hypothetical protein LBH08_03445 [Puniceicoccales bacterium]|jgi:hypothetical protein|nr:hypothetical protein [Puniceicoccales bacterium]
MKKSTQTKKEDLEFNEDKTDKEISQSREHQELHKLEKNPEKHWNFNEEEFDSEIQPKRKIYQSQNTKKIMSDPWSVVPHIPILSRKIATGTKIKGKNIQIRKITSVKSFFKKKSDTSLKTTPIIKRKAKQIDLLTETLPQLIKTTLKDYNSISFKTQAS